MNKFIYVFNNEAKENLLSQGFVLLKENKEKSLYVFENKNQFVFDLSNTDLVYSNMLTF